MAESTAKTALNATKLTIAANTTPKRSYLSLMVLSNIPIILSSFFAYKAGWRINAAVYLLAGIASVMYHRCRELRYGKLDVVLARAFFVCNIIKFISSPRLASGVCAVSSLLTFRYCCSCSKTYESNHPMWHILAGTGTILLYV